MTVISEIRRVHELLVSDNPQAFVIPFSLSSITSESLLMDHEVRYSMLLWVSRSVFVDCYLDDDNHKSR